MVLMNFEWEVCFFNVMRDNMDFANVTLVSDDADNELDFIECTVGVSLEESINNAEREQLRVIFEGTLKKSIEGIRVGSKICYT